MRGLLGMLLSSAAGSRFASQKSTKLGLGLFGFPLAQQQALGLQVKNQQNSASGYSAFRGKKSLASCDCGRVVFVRIVAAVTTKSKTLAGFPSAVPQKSEKRNLTRFAACDPFCRLTRFPFSGYIPIWLPSTVMNT
jgi:hypothetical protein